MSSVGLPSVGPIERDQSEGRAYPSLRNIDTACPTAHQEALGNPYSPRPKSYHPTYCTRARRLGGCPAGEQGDLFLPVGKDHPSGTPRMPPRRPLTWLQERELEKVNAFYLQKEAEVRIALYSIAAPRVY